MAWTFLDDNLEEVYIGLPPGFEKKFGSEVCNLRKPLYGLNQSPRVWLERFTQFVKKIKDMLRDRQTIPCSQGTQLMG